MEKRNLLEFLCDLYADEKPASGLFKSGRQQVQDNAKDILSKCSIQRASVLEILGASPCKVTTLSVDGRGRAQRAMRVDGRKINFRPWHICWIAKYGITEAVNLQYSHRCHEENCCEASHGVWEDDKSNKSRNACRSASHALMPDGSILLLCKHIPPCLTPVQIGLNDGRVFASSEAYRTRFDE